MHLRHRRHAGEPRGDSKGKEPAPDDSQAMASGNRAAATLVPAGEPGALASVVDEGKGEAGAATPVYAETPFLSFIFRSKQGRGQGRGRGG